MPKVELTQISTRELARRKDAVQLSVKQTAFLLNLGRHPTERLMRNGYLEDPSLTNVERLANRPTIGGLPVLRLGDPARDGTRRIGHHRTDPDEILLGASDRWWGGPTAAVEECGWLLLTQSGFIIGLLRIAGISEEIYDDAQYRRVAFEAVLAARIDDLVEPHPRVLVREAADLAHKVLGNRVPNPPGAPIILT